MTGTHSATHPGAAGAAGGRRAIPYHCPFCADEDLHPHVGAPGAWHCRSCMRVFSVQLHGLEAVRRRSAPGAETGPAPAAGLAAPTPAPARRDTIPGGSR